MRISSLLLIMMVLQKVAYICRQVSFQRLNTSQINPPHQQAELASLCEGVDCPCKTSSIEEHSCIYESNGQPASKMQKTRGRGWDRQDWFLLPNSPVELNYSSSLPSPNRRVWDKGKLSEVLHWWSSLLIDGNTKRGDEALQRAHTDNDITPNNNNK